MQIKEKCRLQTLVKPKLMGENRKKCKLCKYAEEKVEKALYCNKAGEIVKTSLYHWKLQDKMTEGEETCSSFEREE